MNAYAEKYFKNDNVEFGSKSNLNFPMYFMLESIYKNFIKLWYIIFLIIWKLLYVHVYVMQYPSSLYTYIYEERKDTALDIHVRLIFLKDCFSKE